MRLITFTLDGEPRVGAETARGVVDFTVAAPALPRTAIELLAAGPRHLRTAVAAMARALEDGVGLISRDRVRLLAPIPRPGKIFGVALNYRDHAAETNRPLPEAPTVFAKASTAVISPGAPIVIPAASSSIDYEGELAVVIGRRTRAVAAARALACVAGYTIMNDVTARDFQRRSGPTLAKSFDSFAPMGPAIVTSDELPDAAGLAIRTTVNGEVLQQSDTGQLIFDVPTLIEYLSAGVTLEPGDVITTGTPSGVGFARTPPRFLRPGNIVCVEIERIGALENPVRGE